MTDTGPVKTPATREALLFGAAIAAAPVAAFLTDRARHITAANAAAANLSGYEIDDLAGLPLRTLYAAHDDWSSTGAIMALTNDQRAATPTQITVRNRDGQLIDVSTLITPLFDNAGQRTGTIEFMTPCDAATQATAAATSPTSDESAILRFARGAAHDFKNLLAIVAGNVQLAASETRPKPRQAFLTDAEHACAVAARLANQMLAFARDRITEQVSLSVPSVFEQQAAMLRAAAGPAITIAFAAAPDTATVRTDRSGLENALLNLVINARDAMPEGGTITVSAANLQILDASAAPQNFVAISVRDTGTGMTERVRRRAFDPFFSTKSLSRGTGLGLATVIGFARQSGGHADIASKIGDGTTVTIVLPAQT